MNDIENLTLRKFLDRITIKQLYTLITVILAILAACVGLGYKWKNHNKEKEIFRLEKELSICAEDKKSLSDSLNLVKKQIVSERKKLEVKPKTQKITEGDSKINIQGAGTKVNYSEQGDINIENN